MITKLRLNSRLLPILVGVVLFMQIANPSRVWSVLLVGLAGTWLLCFLWARSLARSLTFTREMRYGWMQVGDRLEERFTLVNSGVAPAMWVEISDHSDLPGYTASQVTGVGSSGRNQWHTRGMCSRRGLYTLGPTTLTTGDPLGIYTVTLHNPASTTLMVMPPIVPLPVIDVAPGGRSGEGRPRANAPERTISAASVREYTPGDSLRWIHWRTFARRDKPFVRILDGTPAGDWWIVLDLDRTAQVGQGWDSTEEHGVILAASLADRGLRLRRSVGLVASGQELTWLSPEHSEAHRWKILRALALINPGETSLAELLSRNQSSIGRQSSLVIITPTMRSDWIEALIPMLWRGVIATVLLLDPVSFGADPAAASTQAVAATLADLGVARHIITRELLNRPEARPGHAGEWEWRITPTGRAIAVRSPGNTAWRTLA